MNRERYVRIKSWLILRYWLHDCLEGLSKGARISVIISGLKNRMYDFLELLTKAAINLDIITNVYGRLKKTL
jgi:hypothetical protein